MRMSRELIVGLVHRWRKSSNICAGSFLVGVGFGVGRPLSNRSNRLTVPSIIFGWREFWGFGFEHEDVFLGDHASSCPHVRAHIDSDDDAVRLFGGVWCVAGELIEGFC